MINLMPPSYLAIFVLIYMIILTIIDFKKKELPAILSTGLIVGLMLIRPYHIWYGLILAVFGLFMYEAGDGGIGGTADIKALAIIGLMLNSTYGVLFAIGITLVISSAYKLIAKYILKQKKEIPYLIVFTLTYLVLMALGIMGFQMIF